MSNRAARPVLWYLAGELELEGTACILADWTQSSGLLPRFFVPASSRPLKAMDFFRIEWPNVLREAPSLLSSALKFLGAVTAAV